ncbi:VOC family protein, partial [Acinetobacter baumannii]
DIDHVVLRVADMAGMRAFYEGVLGCTLEKGPDHIGLIQLRAGRSLIDLVDIAGTIGREGGAAAGREGRNMEHFCLIVDPFD